MEVRKIQRSNRGGTLTVSLPAEDCRAIGIVEGDYVNVCRVGNVFHVAKVVIS